MRVRPQENMITKITCKDMSEQFNGFEGHVIEEALKVWAKIAEEDIKKANEIGIGHKTIFAQGYFNMITRDLISKVQSLTRQPPKEEEE